MSRASIPCRQSTFRAVSDQCVTCAFFYTINTGIWTIHEQNYLNGQIAVDADWAGPTTTTWPNDIFITHFQIALFHQM